MFDLEAALGSFSSLDVAALEVLVCNIVTKCANSEVVDVLEVW